MISLTLDGFHPLLYRINVGNRTRGKSHAPPQRGRIKFRLSLCRTDEVVALAEKLMSSSHHNEKIAKMRLIINKRRGDWSEIAPKLRRIQKRTKREVEIYTKRAERAYNTPRKRTAETVGSSASLV